MKFKTKSLVTASVLLAMAVIFPAIIHSTGLNGSIFSPMHIPVLLAGFILGPHLGLIVGILSPTLNFLITGMPPMPMVWIMVIELGLYGLIAGIMYKITNKRLIISLITSMIAGRLGGALSVLLLARLFNIKNISALAFLKGATITGLPGIIIQIILVPIIVKIYETN